MTGKVRIEEQVGQVLNNHTQFKDTLDIDYRCLRIVQEIISYKAWWFFQNVRMELIYKLTMNIYQN